MFGRSGSGILGLGNVLRSLVPASPFSRAMTNARWPVLPGLGGGGMPPSGGGGMPPFGGAPFGGGGMPPFGGGGMPPFGGAPFGGGGMPPFGGAPFGGGGMPPFGGAPFGDGGAVASRHRQSDDHLDAGAFVVPTDVNSHSFASALVTRFQDVRRWPVKFTPDGRISLSRDDVERLGKGSLDMGKRFLNGIVTDIRARRILREPC